MRVSGLLLGVTVLVISLVTLLVIHTVREVGGTFVAGLPITYLALMAIMILCLAASLVDLRNR